MEKKLKGKKLDKRMQRARALVKRDLYDLESALSVLEEYGSSCAAKFDETVEVVFKVGVDPRQSDQMVRGSVAMPCGLGKDVRVAVFTKPERHKEALDAGADIVGYEDLISQVKAGRIDFDTCLATPDVMPKLAALGKVLGPKGLMPNPRLGTVAEDIADAVRRVKAGQVEFKIEKAALIHAGIGKLSFKRDALKTNVNALYEAVLAAKPSASKGIYMQKMYISTSQGISLCLDLASMVA